MTLISTNGDSISTWWTLSVTADRSQVQLECATGNGPALCLTAQVPLQQGAWTLLTFCYSETNSAIFANDQLVASGGGLPSVPAALAPSTGLVIGSTLDGQPADGQFDEFAAFCRTIYPRGHTNPWGLDPAWDISIYYSDYAPIAALGPIGSGTGASLASRPSMLASASNSSSTSLMSLLAANTNNFQPPTSTNGLTLVYPTPKSGCFYSLQDPGSCPLPYGSFFQSLNCWAIGDPTNGVYLIDDSSMDYSSYTRDPPGATNSSPSVDTNGFYLSISGVSNGVANVVMHGTTNGGSYTLLSSESLSINSSGSFDGLTQNWLVEQDVLGAPGRSWTPLLVPTFGRTNLFLYAHTGPDDGPRVLFLQITGVDHGTAKVMVYSTAAGQNYDIVSSQSITTPTGAWTSEGLFVGQTNWTPTTVATGSRNPLFLRARSWADSTSSGIPDWWMTKYFGPNRGSWPDPYAELMKDGWTVLDDYQNSWNPWVAHTPPTPSGLSIICVSSNDVVLNWNPSWGSVTGYTVVRWPNITNNLPAGTTSFTDNSGFNDVDPNLGLPRYQIQVHYVGGDSAFTDIWSDSGSAGFVEDGAAITLARGSQNSVVLTANALPEGAAKIRLTRLINYSGPLGYTNLDLVVSSLVDGKFSLPQDWLYGAPPAADDWRAWGASPWWQQALATNSAQGDRFYAQSGPAVGLPFFDGRVQLKQNLAFILRAANQVAPLSFKWTDDFYNDWGDYYFSCPSNYAYSSFVSLDTNYVAWMSGILDFTPFRDNYLFRNFAFNAQAFDGLGGITLGPQCCDQSTGGVFIFDASIAPMYSFPGPIATGTPIPSILSPDTRSGCISLLTTMAIT
ncbi:MAG: hypothetical protein C5B50_19225 [Verrucomicrobia bacterium]|nr:MAG: hypothetical protein C5B50_19225 [Verrucomicrobiota bacterium]